MKPAARFNSIVTTATVFFMWSVFAYLLPWLKSLGDGGNTVAAVGAILSSVALYRLFALGLGWALGRFEKLKAFVFGPYYMHGTWVGYFVGNAGDKRVLIEHFEQNLHGLVIRGRSYLEDGASHATWTSEAASIDSDQGRLIYTYACDILKRQVTLQGVAVFQIERPRADAAATGIEGYTADLINGIRCASFETKLSADLIPFDQAIKEARVFAAKKTKAEQGGVDQPATAPEVKPEGGSAPHSDSEGHPQ